MGGTKNAVYQHDGAGPHRDGRCLAFIKAHFSELLTWPAQSPDLNPMENFWADLKRRLHQAHPVVNNKEDLWKAVEKEIEATPKDFCKKLIESMPSRLNAVIKAQRTEYWAPLTINEVPFWHFLKKVSKKIFVRGCIIKWNLRKLNNQIKHNQFLIYPLI